MKALLKFQFYYFTEKSRILHLFHDPSQFKPNMLFLMITNKSGKGSGTPLQYSCLENPMDRGAWQAAVNGVDKSWRRMSDFTFTFHFHASEKEMATHSSVLAWRIPGMVEPMGCRLWGRTESDRTEATQQQQQQHKQKKQREIASGPKDGHCSNLIPNPSPLKTDGNLKSDKIKKEISKFVNSEIPISVLAWTIFLFHYQLILLLLITITFLCVLEYSLTYNIS